MASAKDTPAPLSPSELGTKDWDNLYAHELQNHSLTPTDTGTVWFSETDAPEKMTSLATAHTPQPKHTATLLDLGCGNNTLLGTLRTQGWTGRALGVDYSEDSVELARRVGASSSGAAVEVAVWDVLHGPLDAVLPDGGGGWDVVFDKGTFDAVSLASCAPCDAYVARVGRLVRAPGGIFVITSCNWTEDELIRWFARDDSALFEVAGTACYRSFSFGGHKGQAVSTVCFRRR
ncbi:hypothetical protein CDD80_6719 [Ophiocordyceps camponoti-rufipedis]|uniref:Protein-lysine N-methyltransferase EFM4 n=1 Tax=Ophiocordyceps camponoti-rufipedis TaxID=2004952 RepID=A0A2C5ZFF1_9HYPO|nr:hypothetical protein CDD80_6719 [Ophiocordyceps camponoti-rufipedis]